MRPRLNTTEYLSVSNIVWSTVSLTLMSSLIASSGCATKKVERQRDQPVTQITLGDFHTGRSDEAPARSERVETPVESQVQTPTETQDAQPATTRVVVETTPAETNGDRVITSSGISDDSGLAFLDAKVGDINGRPIFVSSFFEPIQDRISAIGNDKPLNQWRHEAMQIILVRHDGIMYDELLRAETLAALSPQQRVGLQAFLKDFRSTLLSQNLGSAQLANRRLLEEEGVSLDEALRREELNTLVSLTLHEEVNRRVNISWRDIQQRYERDIEKYQPEPTVVLRVIRVLETEGEEVDAVNARIADGESFESIASSSINTFNTDEDGITETLLESAFEETKFFRSDSINEAIWALSPGERSGAVSSGSSTYWIEYVERQQESISLYDAQVQIKKELVVERRAIERKKYLQDLVERSGVSTREELLLRLLYIAERKFGPMA